MSSKFFVRNACIPPPPLLVLLLPVVVAVLSGGCAYSKVAIERANRSAASDMSTTRGSFSSANARFISLSSSWMTPWRNNFLKFSFSVKSFTLFQTAFYEFKFACDKTLSFYFFPTFHRVLVFQKNTLFIFCTHKNSVDVLILLTSNRTLRFLFSMKRCRVLFQTTRRRA